MSDTTDDMEAGAFELEYAMERRERQLKHTSDRYTWTIKDGNRILIKSMTDTHLINALRMIERRAKKDFYQMIESGNKMLDFIQGEEAINSIEGGLENMITDGEPDIYDVACYEGRVAYMLKVLEKRGLQL